MCALYACVFVCVSMSKCVCVYVQAHVCEAAAMPTRWGMVAAQPAIFLSFSPEHQVWSPISLVLHRKWLLVKDVVQTSD